MYWTIFGIIVGAYALTVLYVSIREIMSINETGKLLEKRAKALENLAALHGYSRDGWERFSEYQNFLEEYKEALDVFHEWSKEPIWFSIKMYGIMIFLAPSMLNTYRKAKAQSTEEQKEERN